MLSAGESRQLQEIEARLHDDDPVLARRLARHRIRRRGRGAARPWVRNLLLALTAMAVAAAAVLLMIGGLELHRAGLVVAGATLLAAVPFVPLLRRRRRVAVDRTAARRARRRRP